MSSRPCDAEDEFARARAALPRTWHACPDLPAPFKPGDIGPWNWLPGTVDEPLLRTVDSCGVARVLSNVCTRCASVMIERARSEQTELRCPDCDATFALNGHGQAQGNLSTVPFFEWGSVMFASLDPARDANVVAKALSSAVGEPASDPLPGAPRWTRDFFVRASWLDVITDALLTGDAEAPYVADASGATRTSGNGNERVTRWLYPCTFVDVDASATSVRIVVPIHAASTRVVSLVFGQAAGSASPAPAVTATEHYAAERRIERRARGRRSRAFATQSPATHAVVAHLHALLDRTSHA